MWPDDKITKRDLIDYHLQMAPYTLQYWSERALTVTRYPNGINEQFFYQKNCPDYAPEWIEQTVVRSSKKEINYIVANTIPTLIWLVNQGSIEFHPSTYKLDNIEVPSFAIIDLDPTYPCGFSETVVVAKYTKVILDELGLEGYPKTSGATGIHIYIPLQPRYTFDISSKLVKMIGKILFKFYPKEVTLERQVKNREGVYVDHLQNSASKTIVGPYSPRSLPGAPISTPVTWNQLTEIEPLDFTLKTVPEYIKKRGDMFAEMFVQEQSLTKILPLLDEIS